ncbi:MAG: hypothetical protein R3A79_16505 [Nannocystaceae bacterium]
MPPRPPLFLGSSIVARETDWGHSIVLEIRPRGGNRFHSPHGTETLYVPLSRVVSVTAKGAAVELVGEFSMTNYEPRLRLAPVDPEDARKLSVALARRLGLPRLPIDLPSLDLQRGLPEVLVCVTDEVHASHPEMANFAGLRLRGGHSRRRETPGERLRVTGFYDGGYRGEGVRPVGYTGSTLGVVSIEGAHLTSVALDHAGGRVDAWLGEGHGRWLWRRSPTQRLAGLVHGHSAQKAYPWATDGHVRALRGLLAGAPVGRAPESPSPYNVSGWADLGVGARVRHGPLPEAAEALLSALDGDLGAIFAPLRVEPLGVAADGVLACVEGRRVTALRRGVARIYRVRPDGAAELVVPEASRLRAAADIERDRAGWEQRIAAACFGGAPAAADPPSTFDLASGERLVIVTGDALLERDDAALRAAVAEPKLAGAAAQIEGAGAPIEGTRWGLMAIAPGVEAARPG